MYQNFYELKDNPFRLTPDPSFLCMTAQHREALSGLVYSVCTRPGLTVLVGEAGTGKTTLLYALLELLEKRRFVTAICTNPTLTRQEFYDLLMLKFGIDCPSFLKSRQLTGLQEMLLRNRKEGRPSLLIVDEAQRLSTELLEEIRLLLNMETPREKLLQIIVAGQPELADVLKRPEMRQLKQRISCLCRLRPLNQLELQEYLRHRLAHAGLRGQPLFLEASVRAIYDFTQGIPRLVNSLCDSALQIGFALQSPRITVSIVQEAAKDLELTPNFSLTDLERVDDGDLFSLTQRDAKPSPIPVPEFRGDRDVPKNGDSTENYTSRQKSFKFLGGLVDRWR